MSTNLEKAQAYAARGWTVFPIHTAHADAAGTVVCSCGKHAGDGPGDCASPGKHPRYHPRDLRRGCADATTDAARLRTWWTRWPKANIGLATGEASGLAVVDIDPRHGGTESLEALTAKHGAVPATVESLTGGGGRHLLFKYRPGFRNTTGGNGRGIAPGIDTRGDGGYIVAPPSVHSSGGVYAWEGSSDPDAVGLADLPDWLFPGNLTFDAPTAPDRPPVADGEPVGVGSRNTTAASLAGRHIANGASLHETRRALDGWNKTNPVPLGDAELDTVVASVARTHVKNNPGATIPVTEGTASRKRDGKRRAKLTCMADVEAREVTWLWPNRIPQGCISGLAGVPGEGKSFLTTDMVARITTGENWPDGSPCPLGSVILICAEDDPNCTIRPRLDAHGADVRKVHLLSGIEWTTDEDGEKEFPFTLQNMTELEEVLAQLPDCKLIVIDPIGSYMKEGTDSHRDNEVRANLSGLVMLAQKYGPAVLMVAHRRKSPSSHADDTVLGSRAFTGISRAVWHLSHDPENEERKLFLPGKLNFAKKCGGLSFTIEGAGNSAKLVWENGDVAMSANDALAVENAARDGTPGPKPKARDAAADWLSEQLATGEVEVAALRAEVKAAGMAWPTVDRAANKIGVVRLKPDDMFRGWRWTMPTASHKSGYKSSAA